MNYLFLCVAVMVSLANATSDVYKPEKPIEQVSKSLSSIEKDVRAAAVKVTTAGGGHGTGSLIKYKDVVLVITAKHVAKDPIGTEYAILKDGESVRSTLLYKSDIADVSVLMLNGTFLNKGVKPMPWKTTKTYNVGMDIVYSGYPSWHKLMSFKGRIAGYEVLNSGATQLIVNTYGWFGCSGSVLYSTKGHIVGILYGVDIEYYPNTQVNENMIWVAPIKQINIDEVLKALCMGSVGKYKACQ